MEISETEGNQDETEKNGEGTSGGNEKKEVKIQENVGIGEIDRSDEEEEEGGGLSRAMRAATMVQKHKKMKDPTRWDVLWMQFWYFCDDTSLHGWNYVARFPGAGAKGWVHRALWILVKICSYLFVIPSTPNINIKSLSLCLLA